MVSVYKTECKRINTLEHRKLILSHRLYLSIVRCSFLVLHVDIERGGWYNSPAIAHIPRHSYGRITTTDDPSTGSLLSLSSLQFQRSGANAKSDKSVSILKVGLRRRFACNARTTNYYLVPSTTSLSLARPAKLILNSYISREISGLSRRRPKTMECRDFTPGKPAPPS